MLQADTDMGLAAQCGICAFERLEYAQNVFSNLPVLIYEFQGPGIIQLGYGPVRKGGTHSPSLLVKPFKHIADGIPTRTAVLNTFMLRDILLLLYSLQTCGGYSPVPTCSHHPHRTACFKSIVDGELERVCEAGYGLPLQK